jgi:hypothetical protein
MSEEIILGWINPNQMVDFLIRSVKLGHRHRIEGHVKTATETGRNPSIARR